MTRKLFISYSRKDKQIAQRVADALEVEGYDVFWDAEIPPGQKFDAYIFSKLQESHAVVVLWSRHSVTSDYVKEEADYARANSVLVPLRIDETGLPFGFTRIHTTDLLHWHGSVQDSEWRKVVSAIEMSLREEGSIARDSSAPEAPGREAERSHRSIPIRTDEPPRTHIGASATVALAVVMLMLLGIVFLVLRLM